MFKNKFFNLGLVFILVFVLMFLTFCWLCIFNFHFDNVKSNSLSITTNCNDKTETLTLNNNYLNQSSNFSYNSLSRYSKTFENNELLFNETDIKNLEKELYFNNFDDIKDRTAGSSGEKKFAEILANKLENLNFSYFLKDNSYIQTFSLGNYDSQNVVGVYNQINSNNEFDNKYILLGAHIDAVFKDEKSFGFNDNLSGVLGVLLLAQSLINQNFGCNIIVAFYGAEEVGCKGSQYFIENLDTKIKNNILLAVNFDSIGAGENLYYYHSDNSTLYGSVIDNLFNKYSISKLGFNQKFSTLSNLNINHTSLGFLSDNSSFLKAGVNSLTFFAGDLDAKNGLGFFEKQGYEKIMHNTDSFETCYEVFGEKFYENIFNCASYVYNLLNNEEFNTINFQPNQIDVISYSDWALKIVGVVFILVLFVLYLIIINNKYKTKKNITNKNEVKNKK